MEQLAEKLQREEMHIAVFGRVMHHVTNAKIPTPNTSSPTIIAGPGRMTAAVAATAVAMPTISATKMQIRTSSTVPIIGPRIPPPA